MLYVDTPTSYTPDQCPMRGKCGVAWAHLITDGPVEELHDLALVLKLPRDWFQDTGTAPHYDIPADKISEAEALGARSISRKELVSLLMGKKLNKG